MHDRQPYSGSQRRLVLAFDLGTTFSGVSYALLDPGKVPQIQTVSRYPGQDVGHSKIPTILYYDKHGRVVAAGAEDLPVGEDDEDEDEGQDEEDEDEDTCENNQTNKAPTKVEWFKLLLSPTTDLPDHVPRPELPPSKTIVDVYADFYRYLHLHTQKFIKETHPILIWDSFENNTDIVLSHPNGWEGPQQSIMRNAAVKAGLVRNDEEGRDRITFVTEGEASLHYCISSGLTQELIEDGNNIMIIDAGGGTVDLSTYTFESSSPIKVKEIAIPDCIFEGSVIVRQRAEAYIRAKLRNSRFGTEEYVNDIANAFDEAAKKRFKGTSGANVKFSQRLKDSDSRVGVQSGSLKLSKSEVLKFFDPGVQAIIDAVEEQRHTCLPNQLAACMLVGGFAENVYLFSRLESHLQSKGLQLYRPQFTANKAVAEGSVSFHIDHFVNVRVARYTYGVKCHTKYEPSDPSHVARLSQIYTGLDGSKQMPGIFSSILNRATQVAEAKEFRRSYYRNWEHTFTNSKLNVTVTGYRGNSQTSDQFIDEDQLCMVSFDLDDVPCAPRQGPKGVYYRQDYDVIILFGLTELKAQVAWLRDGVEQRSTAELIYNEDLPVNVSDN